MSDFGEEIINRLPETSSLHDKDNPARKLLNKSIGEWLFAFEEANWFDMFFIDSSEEVYLDLHGKEYNVKRRIGESDESYRKRIIYETLGHLTVDYLLTVYDLRVYVFVEDFSVNDNDLTSDNPYLSSHGFMVVADDNVKNILNNKFVLDSNVSWLVL